MRILVTGGMGFIGHNVVAQLEMLGHDVLTVDNYTNYGIVSSTELTHLVKERAKKVDSMCHPYDIADLIVMDRTFNTFKPELVIHLASFPRQKAVGIDPGAASRTMSEGLLNLCEVSAKHNVKRFVYISSSMVYGNFADSTTEHVQCDPIGQYGIMKLAGEMLVKDYTKRGCFDYTILRPSAVYGPLDVNDRVVAKFILAAMQDQPLEVNGSGESLDFTYVEDAASGIVGASLSNTAANRTYNITRGRGVSLLEAASLVTEIVGKGTLKIAERDNTFPSRGALDISAAHRDFGYNPTVNILEGFQRYYDYLNNTAFRS